MSSLSYPIFELHYKQIGCGYCKFKNPYEWKCNCVFSPMKGSQVNARTNCDYFKRVSETRIR